MWDSENPHAIVQSRHQYRFSINVWAGIVGNHLIGPHILTRTLNGNIYTEFLEIVLPDLLENVPLATRKFMWFMHDGAPPHYSLTARKVLDNNYRRRWIGRSGPIAWPPRSPDLNMCDFFLWGHLKSLVYSTPINSEDDLLERIVSSCERIRNTPGIFQHVRDSMKKRVVACIDVSGGHFEHLL